MPSPIGPDEVFFNVPISIQLKSDLKDAAKLEGSLLKTAASEALSDWVGKVLYRHSKLVTTKED